MTIKLGGAAVGAFGGSGADVALGSGLAQNAVGNNQFSDFDSMTDAEKEALSNGCLLTGSVEICVGFGGITKVVGALVKNIFINGYKVNKEVFHRVTKEIIKKNAGRFEKTVGKNPNVGIKNGKIILEGQGPYKGKTFETNLNANDYFK